MIVTLTKKELEKIEKGEAEIDRRHKAAEEKARALRPDAPTPPYGDAKEEEIAKIYYEWMKAGSKEWRQAFNEERVIYFELGTVRNKVLQEADEKLLKRISKSQAATVRELKRQVGIFLQSDYLYNKDGAPDFDHIRRELKDLFYKPMQTLDTDNQVEIENFIDLETGKLPPRVEDHKAAYRLSCGITNPIKGTDSGAYLNIKRGKETYKEPIPCDYSVYYFVPVQLEDETTERDHIVTRPKDYVTTVDRPTQKLFENRLTKPVNAGVDSLYAVRLDGKDKVNVRVGIDYNELLSMGKILELPELNQRDYSVHDAIITQLCAGNRVMSYDMIYRAMTGKVNGKITVPDDAKKIIDEALEKFRGTFKLEYSYIDDDGKEMVESYDEPLVTFRRLVKKEKINGKVVTGGIALSDDTKLDPPLLKWARFNGNEIDTRDITLLDVPSLNNGDESFTIKMCLYRRLISMRNSFERKYHSKKELPANQRSIRYDYVYEALGIVDPNVDKRKLIKNKIDRCMGYWKDKGLITGYRHKKDKAAGNTYYAVEVSFME